MEKKRMGGDTRFLIKGKKAGRKTFPVPRKKGMEEKKGRRKKKFWAMRNARDQRT